MTTFTEAEQVRQVRNESVTRCSYTEDTKPYEKALDQLLVILSQGGRCTDEERSF